jgi:CRP/FNR family transcriptional regulator
MALDKVSALKRSSLFTELDENTLGALAERAFEQQFQKDDVLFVAGEEAQGLYVIVEGAVRAFRVSADGREQVIHVERTGATIAEVPVFDGGAYPSTAAADEPTITLFIDKRDVRQLVLKHPEIAFAALKVLAGRVRRCAELVEALSLREVGQRLARFLVAEARRTGPMTNDRATIDLSQTNQQIASRIGSVREVVSRAFTRLQHQGLIIVEGRKVTIPDMTALESLAASTEGIGQS